MEHQVVDLAFNLRGETIPADHGYALCGAVCRVVPGFHGDPEVGIHPVRGRLVGGRQLALGRGSRLVLRLAAGRIAEALPLAGRRLDVDGAALQVGVPVTLPLRPAATLASRLVVIKGFTEPEPFLEAVRRQLAALGSEGTASLLRRRAQHPLEGGSGGEGAVVRRTIRIRDKDVVGFPVLVGGLDAVESMRLQEAGIGGRRRFGCGLFVPVRG